MKVDETYFWVFFKLTQDIYVNHIVKEKDTQLFYIINHTYYFDLHRPAETS